MTMMFILRRLNVIGFFVFLIFKLVKQQIAIQFQITAFDNCLQKYISFVFQYKGKMTKKTYRYKALIIYGLLFFERASICVLKRYGFSISLCGVG